MLCWKNSRKRLNYVSQVSILAFRRLPIVKILELLPFFPLPVVLAYSEPYSKLSSDNFRPLYVTQIWIAELTFYCFNIWLGLHDGD